MFVPKDDMRGNWLAKLYKRGKISLDDLHRTWGKWCNLPECCIEFFIEMEAKHPNRSALVSEMIYGIDDSVPYVRCPKCRRQKYEY